ncbi:MAG: CBS domain-containing protein [Deltaproteobacteria bacterium]|nr:CBS domain-containing protein [Deltaproteobacteria bacterium]
MRVNDIMTPAVRVVQSDLDAEAAWQKMRTARIRHLVVMDDDRVVGIVSAHDLGGPREGAARKGQTVNDVMTPDPVVASPTMSLREAANVLRGRAIGCLPVIDGARLVGIVTTTDLLDLIGRGAERPVADSTRWVLRARGPRTAKLMRAKATANRKTSQRPRARA